MHGKDHTDLVSDFATFYFASMIEVPEACLAEAYLAPDARSSSSYAQLMDRLVSALGRSAVKVQCTVVAADVGRTRRAQ